MNAPMSQSNIVHVAVVPPKSLDADVAKMVASLVNKEIFDTRLLLAGEIPRIIAHDTDIDRANSIARNIRDAGLVAFVCGDSELRNHSAGFVAHTVKPGEGEVLFRDKVGRESKVETGDIFLILKGRMRSHRREEISTTKIKINVPATVLMGGFPIMRRVTKKTGREALQLDDFVKIYDRRSPHPRIEMSQNHIDYAFLGPRLTSSVPANFPIVVAKLREWFPQAIFDERLTKPFKTDLPTASPREALEITCKLIYLCHLAMDRR
jgi:hypothetical protein